MKYTSKMMIFFSALTFGCAGSCGGGGGDTLRSELGYDEDKTDLVVIFNRDLKGSEDLHVRVRSLAEGETLDCSKDSGSIPTFDSSQGNGVYTGPKASTDMFERETSPEDLLNPTEESTAQRRAETFFVDVCVMDGSNVAHQARYDIRQALDRKGKNGKFDELDDGVRIASNQAYAQACVERMGEIPFWDKIGEEGENDYNTVNCLEVGTPIPSTIDGVPHDNFTGKCDNPQYIYSHCEPDATIPGVNGPRVTSARNEEGTSWVLLCRKSHRTEGRYEDMAMIGHNPFTGDTCFFQNQLPSGQTERPSNDGMNIPHPADDVSSEESPQVWNDLWGGIEGGMGPSGGIQCMGCHSTDPFIHTPWIDGAVDESGNPIVPKMGFHPDFVEGYRGPYHLLDADDQGWTEPKILVSEEASSCTSCHSIALDQWTSPSSNTSRNNPDGGCVFCGQAPWVNRMEGLDSSWENLITDTHKTFEDTFWMPPNAAEISSEVLWPESEMKAAIDFIKFCGENPTDEKCVWEPLPREPGDPTELPEVEETGIELAKKALTTFGAPISVDGVEQEGSRRCAECHATSKFGFTEWGERTLAAYDAGIRPRTDPTLLSQEEAVRLVNFMRKFDDVPDSVFAAEKIGVFAAGVQFPYFQKLFQTAYGTDWGLQYGAFLSRVSMPKGSHAPLSADEFASIVKWYVDENHAHLNELLIETPPPSTCEEVRAQYNVTGPSPWLESHLDDMQFDGWGARNEEAGINMYDLSGKSSLTEYEAGVGQLLLVKDLGFNTSFWMRTSADGRFVGNGGRGTDISGFGATITDLVTDKNIAVKGSYDPGFFPNNQAFIMQGGAGICTQSILTNDAETADGISFTEAGCTKAQGINLYQHVAVNTDGGDYFVINGEFTSDSGSGSKDPSAPFYQGSTMKFSPLVFDGAEWSQKPAVIVNSPYEGDSVLSPSGKLVISRFAGPDGVALGHMIRRVQATPNADSYDINIEEEAQFICTPGAKSNISFDERFAVTHHYENDTANIYLSDILTGETVKVTEMPAGTKALFPHFVSNGWFYFLITGGDGGDRAVASDAALIMAQ